MGTYELLVAAAIGLMLFALVGLIIKKGGKVLILCALGLLVVFGPMAYAALTK